jgi:hypothetical protein
MSEPFLDQEFQEYNDDRIAELTKERDEWRSLVVRVASIHDGKPHNKWVRQLGVEARRILGKESK